ncbi:AI-2E family transporter [Candidatus Pacearchaeota archaeon]|nr:AI-2E family transporter [Candidatus Pacearchaeota archaeon]
MIKEAEKDFGKYVLLAIVVGLVFLAYKIISPYIIVLISAFILAYMARPVYLFLNRKLSAGFSAFICLLLILAIFIIPVGLVLTQVGFQTYDFVQEGTFYRVSESISSLPIVDKFNLDISALGLKFFSFLLSLITDFATQIPAMVLSFLVFLFAVYYTLISWETISRKLQNFLPFDNKNKVVAEIDHSTKGIVFGYLLIAIIDFVVAATGFYLLGIHLYLLLAFLIAIFAFVPGVGPGFVWVPTAAYYIINGNYFVGGGVVVLGVILGFFIETLLMTRILGKTAKIHPLIMLLGILGGISIFGLFGFIIGPLILIYAIKVVTGIVEGMGN